MNTPTPRPTLCFPEMEVQHGYCYRLFDAIEPVAAEHNHDRLAHLLREIEHYLMFHFACEEHLMRMYDFPGFAIHQTDHERAGNRFIEFLDQFDANTLNPAALRIFLTGWLMEHSELSDRDYVAWIEQRRGELFRE